MSQSLLSILILAGIAVFLIIRLRDVLGTRDGFEPENNEPPMAAQADAMRKPFEVIEGGPDHDIIDNVPEGSRAADNFAAIKKAENAFSVGDFLSGAGTAYEMILMAFENDRLDDVQALLSEDVKEAFEAALADRREKGLKVECQFIGLREIQIIDAELNEATNEAEIKTRFVSELSTIVKDSDDKIIEGGATDIHRQKDIWTFSRVVGKNDPNWLLVATAA